MEVQHHPDLYHKKKKLREYLLEFLMIFLVVNISNIIYAQRQAAVSI
jgi:hypothetical protein